MAQHQLSYNLVHRCAEESSCVITSARLTSYCRTSPVRESVSYAQLGGQLGARVCFAVSCTMTVVVVQLLAP